MIAHSSKGSLRPVVRVVAIALLASLVASSATANRQRRTGQKRLMRLLSARWSAQLAAIEKPYWQPLRTLEDGRLVFEGAMSWQQDAWNRGFSTPFSERFRLLRTGRWEGRNARSISELVRDQQTGRIIGEIRWRAATKETRLWSADGRVRLFDSINAALDKLLDEQPDARAWKRYAERDVVAVTHSGNTCCVGFRGDMQTRYVTWTRGFLKATPGAKRRTELNFEVRQWDSAWLSYDAHPGGWTALTNLDRVGAAPQPPSKVDKLDVKIKPGQVIALAGTVERSPPDAEWLGRSSASLSRQLPQMNLWAVPADALRGERFTFTIKRRGKRRQQLRFIVDKPRRKRTADD